MVDNLYSETKRHKMIKENRDEINWTMQQAVRIVCIQAEIQTELPNLRYKQLANLLDVRSCYVERLIRHPRTWVSFKETAILMQSREQNQSFAGITVTGRSFRYRRLLQNLIQILCIICFI
jgi:hypothetical protein